MQAVGVIVEYNPFHNGHLHHFHEAKRVANADVVVAVMSGHFLQRGEPALVDKWTRTKMALKAGVDLVIELPYAFATAQAPQFAAGSTYLLNALKCNSFAFGSEAGSIEPFINTYRLMQEYTEEYNKTVKDAMKAGNSYPKALHIAFESLKGKTTEPLIDLNQPNNILGYHYVEAAMKQQLAIKPLTIQRIQAGYHDDINTENEIASATGIRKAIFEENNLQAVQQFVPYTTFEQLLNWQQQNQSFISWETVWPMLQYAILRHSPNQLKQYADVAEGLENSLLKHAAQATTFQQFMSGIKSKRYTWTRLQRTFLHIFTGVTKDLLHAHQTPSYIRILGMTQNGQKYLSHIKKEVTLPLISRVGSNSDPLLALDLHATTIYNLCLQHIGAQKIDGDIHTPPIRL
jgi:predicted nucleotidyltransferase